ncbi:MAG: hypothetical protein INR70_08065 [Parafilimonas terrae]|nr:hypothetical protein [Parafilimonas terrae]
MSSFCPHDAVTFAGGSYAAAENWREAFEAACWNAGIVPIRGPTLAARIEGGVTHLVKAYRYADLSGDQTETAYSVGCALGAEAKSIVHLGQW